MHRVTFLVEVGDHPGNTLCGERIEGESREPLIVGDYLV